MSIPMPKHQVQYEIKDKEKGLKKENFCCSISEKQLQDLKHRGVKCH